MVPQEGFKREGKGKITGEERRGGDRISGSSLLQREKNAERKERRAGESVCEIEGIPSEREEEGGRISIHASEGAWAGWIRLPIQGPGFREGFPDA